MKQISHTSTDGLLRFPMTISNAVFEECLYHLQKLDAVIHGDVVVGGGAPRDIINDKPVKDIDVFLHYTDHNVAAVNGAFEGWSVTQDCSMEYMTDDVVRVLEYSLWPTWTPVNFIFMRDTVSLNSALDRFDFGICQVGCLSDGKMYSTRAFQQDLHERTFTMMRHESVEKDRSLRRWERLSSKYQGWTLVCPD